MEYADVTSDRRTLDGNTRMAYSLLGLTAQGPNGGTAHTELFVRDPNTTLISRVQAANNDNNALYYLVDGLGSIIATTSRNGTTIKKYDYDPFGSEINPNPTPTDTNPWRYAAGYHDTSTGLTNSAPATTTQASCAGHRSIPLQEGCRYLRLLPLTRTWEAIRKILWT